MYLRDTLDASTVTARICTDGSLVADVRAARVGIQTYSGREVDPDGSLGLRDKAIVRVYRPEEEVFNKDSLASFAAAPVTIDHPTEAVTADNWRKIGVGEIHGDVIRDGSFVRVPVIVRDAASVEKVRTTHKQLSMGYSCTLDAKPGETPTGEAYDAVQRNIRINHIAAVPAARGGPELKISDERLPQQPPEKPVMKTMLIDGLTVDMANADTAIATVQTLIAARDAATTKLTTAEAQAVTDAATIVAKDAEIAKLTTDLAAAKPTLQQLRDAGKAFAVIEGKAKALGVAATDAMDEAAIMKAVVDKQMPGNTYVGDHVRIAFDALTKDAKVDDKVPSIPAPKIIGDAATREATALATANNHNAWRTAGAAA